MRLNQLHANYILLIPLEDLYNYLKIMASTLTPIAVSNMKVEF